MSDVVTNVSGRRSKSVTNTQILRELEELRARGCDACPAITSLDSRIKIFQTEAAQRQKDIEMLKHKVLDDGGLNEQMITLQATVGNLQKAANRLENAATAIVIALTLTVIGLILNLLLQHGSDLAAFAANLN